MSKKQSWFRVSAKGGVGGRPSINIYGDIGAFGVNVSDFATAFGALGKPKEIEVHINSDGGDVFQGNAIFNLLRRSDSKIITVVDGLAASMGSVIAQAGDERVMAENSMLMIHNPWGVAVGNAPSIAEFAKGLEQMQADILQAYAARSTLSEDEIQAMMDKESWISAERAVEYGLADRVEPGLQMAALNFDFSKWKRVPKSLRAQAKKEYTMAKTPKKANGQADDEFEDEGENGGTVKTEAEIRAEVMKTAKNIRSMCALAGLPDLADKLIEDDADVETVIAALDTARAEADKNGNKRRPQRTEASENETSARHRPNTGEGTAVEVDTVDVYAKWNSAGKKRAA